MNDPRTHAIREKCEELAERVAASMVDEALEQASRVARLREPTPVSALRPRVRSEADAVDTAGLAIAVNLRRASELLDRVLAFVGAVEDACALILELTGGPDEASLWDCPGLRDIAP